MLVYIIPFTLLVMISFKDIFKKKYTLQKQNIILWSFFAYLTLLAGIRHGIGVDYFSYQQIFNGVNNFQDYSYLEPGFRGVIVIIKKMGLQPQLLFFIFAALALFILLYGIKQNSYFPILSTLIYLSVFYTGYIFNGMRQAVTMSIFLYSIQFIKNKKMWKVLLLTSIAMSMHSSGIFILIAYIFSKIKFNKKMLVFLFIISIVFVFFNNVFSDNIINIMPAQISSKLLSYSNNFKTSIDVIGLIQRVIIIIPFFIYYSMLRKVDDNFEIMFNIYFLGFILYAIFSFQGMFATRINMLFRILEVVLIPYFFKLKINRFDRFIIFLFIILWMASVYFSVFKSPYYNPFITIFDKI